MSRTLSAAYSPFRASNLRCDFPSIPNALTTATPVTCSCRKAFIRASFRRISRFDSRIRFFSSSTNSTRTGRTAKVTSARRVSIQSRIAAVPASTAASPIVETRPEERSSWSASTSEVRRVMRRPVGVRSKKTTGSRCIRANMSRRSARITRCPRTDTAYICR